MHLFLIYPSELQNQNAPKDRSYQKPHTDTYIATTAVLFSPALQKILARAVAKARLLSSWVGSPLKKYKFHFSAFHLYYFYSQLLFNYYHC